MNTPICDFVKHYSNKDPVRLHMPGHKGKPFLGAEPFDITEIDGADSLYEADGIIAQSEKNASNLFGCRTFFSTEGSSHCIRAMLYLIALYALSTGQRPLIAATRNIHKSFLGAVALLNLDVEWLCPESTAYYLSCGITPEGLDNYLRNAKSKPTAVYLTSPDYLGATADIRAMSAVCRKHGVLLAVDNAHGAYLKFLPESMHPIDLGADICCDSAHKTLPVLTGGAYLHISDSLSMDISETARRALSIFGSTSPSYLILQSLDAANAYLIDCTEKLSRFTKKLSDLKGRLFAHGYRFYGDEPLKLTINAKEYGYFGYRLARILLDSNVVCEFSDRDFITMMFTPENGDIDLSRTEKALLSIPQKARIEEEIPRFIKPPQDMPVRQALLSESELLPVSECVNRTVAFPTIGCPPAVPVLVCGEKIDRHAISCLEYYGIKKCSVVKTAYRL